MTPIAVKDLLEAGVHFGHQTKRWNPKMKQFIFGERNGIYIIDLSKTARLFTRGRAVPHGAGRRRAARCCSSAPSARLRTPIAEEAQRCGMFYVNERWLGGLLTNFSTIQRSLGAAARPRGDGHRRPLRLAVEEGNRPAREGEAQAPEEPGRHPQHGLAARRALRRRHQATSRLPSTRRASCASRSSAWSTPTAIPTRSTSSSPATTTPCARFGCSPRASPTRCSKAAACASRRRSKPRPPTRRRRSRSTPAAAGRRQPPRRAAAAPEPAKPEPSRGPARHHSRVGLTRSERRRRDAGLAPSGRRFLVRSSAGPYAAARAETTYSRSENFLWQRRSQQLM